MDQQKRILVFPCGSEIALEVHRSLKHNHHFELFGGSSVSDHGRFVYTNYTGDIPYHDHPQFIPAIKEIVALERIDAIFPAMDTVARTLKNAEEELGVKVIGSPRATTAICASKISTYRSLANVVPLPKWSEQLCEESEFPVVIKPDEGYGTRNVFLAEDYHSAMEFLRANPLGKYVFCEYLPGREYTIDCFSNRRGELLFVGSRERIRVSNGISVNTMLTGQHQHFLNQCAERINKALHFRGAWFFQMKEAPDGLPKLLEVAARFGGSSSVCRSAGANFSSLSIYDAFDIDVEILTNDVEIELDRALTNRYKTNYKYDRVYVDYDDCVLINGRINHELVGFLYSLINKGVELILLTKHAGNLAESLRRNRLADLFDKVVQIEKADFKHRYIDPTGSIFIDDSFSERKLVKENLGIPVFALDMIESLHQD